MRSPADVDRARDDAETSRSRWLAVAIVSVAIVQFAYEGRHVQPHIDDAYISYRYARNLVEGNGLVFNIGERVEGYTNLLWTLLVAAGLALGIAAEKSAHLLSLASGILALAMTYWYACVGVPVSQRWVAALAPLLLLWSEAFPLWAFSGLETPLFTALVAATLAAEARGRLGLATIAAILASLTRPEGVLLAALVFPLHWARAPKSHTPRVLAYGAIYAAAILALTAFRLLYYGSPIPNTFYAKVDGPSLGLGLFYLHAFLLSGVLPLLIPATWAALHDRVNRVGAAWTLAMALYIVSVGGDVFDGHRFWLPVLPAIAALATRAVIGQRGRPNGRRSEILFATCILASAAWTLLSPALAVAMLAGLALAAVFGVWGRRPRWAVALILVLSAGVVAHHPSDQESKTIKYLLSRHYASTLVAVRPRATAVQQRLNHRHFFVGRLKSLARKFNRQHQATPIGLLATIAIGVVGYDTGLPVLDLMGLTDAHISRSSIKPSDEFSGLQVPGHFRTDADYVIRRRPDYILIRPPNESGRKILPAQWQLWHHPDFTRMYEWNEQLGAYRVRDEYRVAHGTVGATQ